MTSIAQVSGIGTKDATMAAIENIYLLENAYTLSRLLH
jgi:hypothetical protein